jgi:mannan endo-1,4-beta-mannosidase
MKNKFAALCMLAGVLSLPAFKSGDKGGIGASGSHGRQHAGSKFKVLSFLYRISGSKTVAGIHNREPSAMPARWTSEVFAATGKYPGLWSGDFLFQQDNIDNRQVMIDEAVKEWKKGAIVNIMWHACNPALAQPCDFGPTGVLSKLTDEQWTELTTENSPLNKKWKTRVDEIAGYLQFLKDKGVEVLWRPMHEMNQGAFWWGGRPGAEGTVKLYRMLHDYLVKEKHLTNLIWVWDVQDFGTLRTDVHSYDPGKGYWDLAALDVYDGSGYTREKYDIMVGAAGGKPIAIGECQRLPSAEELEQQPRWTFFMGWSELEFSKNTKTEIQKLHSAPNVLTLDEMPGW